MADWLLKTEPNEYGFADLVRDKTCVWDGVSNAVALEHLRAIKKGDRVLVYHTGNEKAVVGTADVVRGGYSPGDDPKQVVIDLKPGRPLPSPVTLKTIKADKAFDGWELVRLGRLSVMPVPAAAWSRIERLSEAGS